MEFKVTSVSLSLSFFLLRKSFKFGIGVKYGKYRVWYRWRNASWLDLHVQNGLQYLETVWSPQPAYTRTYYGVNHLEEICAQQWVDIRTFSDMRDLERCFPLPLARVMIFNINKLPIYKTTWYEKRRIYRTIFDSKIIKSKFAYICI